MKPKVHKPRRMGDAQFKREGGFHVMGHYGVSREDAERFMRLPEHLRGAAGQVARWHSSNVGKPIHSPEVSKAFVDAIATYEGRAK
jgi:hypothetical protein